MAEREKKYIYIYINAKGRAEQPSTYIHVLESTGKEENTREIRWLKFKSQTNSWSFVSVKKKKPRTKNTENLTKAAAFNPHILGVMSNAHALEQHGRLSRLTLMVAGFFDA